MGNFVDTYRGQALAWEMDHLGHLNMRHYFAKASEARVIFFNLIGLRRAFRLDALSTVEPITQHIKYHKEARAGQGIYIKTGLSRLDEEICELVHMIYVVPRDVENGEAIKTEVSDPLADYPSDQLAATIVEQVRHVSRRTRESFAWPTRVRDAASAFMVAVPKTAQTRGLKDFDIRGNHNISLSKHDISNLHMTHSGMDVIDLSGPPSMAEADELGLAVIGQGVYQPSECNVFGRVRTHALIGRISNSAMHLRSAFLAQKPGENQMGTALLEACAFHYHRPKAGHAYVIRSGLRSANTHTKELCHWVMDPETGICFSSFIAVGCRFDMGKRRLVKISDADLEALQASAVSGLRP